MSPRVVPRKLDSEKLLEVLENRIPTLWKFQMDKEGFDASSSTIKEFTEMCVQYKECESAMQEKLAITHKSPLEMEGKCKAKYKVEDGYCNWGRHSMEERNITMVHSKDHMHHESKDRSHNDKKVYFCSNKITKAFSCQEKKEKARPNKFKPLPILSGSNAGDSNSKSK
eukprot:9673443-Ditylum_brightwellii.AAC.1